MTQRRSFYRKVAYFIGIAALLVPLSALSRPSSVSATGDNPGGQLAQMRTEHGLAQANLGEIDPASETMKLATLGFRGIAVNVLWSRANYYKKTEDWTNLSATLEQMTKLQPNFISVWQFQAWNLSYNVSVEFDDYHDRYAWVIRGINFLKEGEKYNEDEPRILWDIGWFIAQKIGRADEHKQFRRLFQEDDDFHPPERPRELRDNWLVGKEWFLKAQEVVDTKGKSIQGKSPLIFHSDPAMAQMNYAEALEEDGTHGERAGAEWRQAEEEWHDYGTRSILSSFGVRVRLNDEEEARAQGERYRDQLDQLTADVVKQLKAEREAKLTEEQKEALAAASEDRTTEQHQLAAEAERTLEITPSDIAQRVQQEDPERAREATRLARQTMETMERAEIIDRYRDIVNFEYWRERARVEKQPDTLAARELIYKGDQALQRADLLAAKEYYDRGMALWRKVFDNADEVFHQGTTGEDLIDTVVRYRNILNEIDEEFPQDFILRDIVERHDREGKLADVFASRGEAEEPQSAEPAELPSEGRPPEPE